MLKSEIGRLRGLKDRPLATAPGRRAGKEATDLGVRGGRRTNGRSIGVEHEIV